MGTEGEAVGSNGRGKTWWFLKSVYNTLDGSISETRLSPTSQIVGSNPCGQAAGGSFLHAVSVISTQFLPRVREGSLTYPDELWRRLWRRIRG